MGVDIHSFPPELPPEPRPDTDDIEGDDLDRARATQPAHLDGEPMTETELAAEAPELPSHPCDYGCGRPAQIGVYYLADGTQEWACFPCFGTVVAQALNMAADEVEQDQPA